MKKQNILVLLIGALLIGGSAGAQNIFWSYDDAQRESIIPPQCDGQFNEELGGVFVPSSKEMYDFGLTLLNGDENAQAGAGYCLLGAASRGYIPAQAKVAQLYYKGEVLPQSNMAAYRWAYVAGLQGDTESQQLAMSLEQFLTTTEMKLATDVVPDMLKKFKDMQAEEEGYSEADLEDKRQELAEINKEIDEMLEIDVEAIINEAKQEVQPDEPDAGADKSKVVPSGKIFNENDRDPSFL